MAETANSLLVLDTHIVLDVFVFMNPSCQDVGQALQTGNAQWLATRHMMDELLWVCERAYMAPWLARRQWSPQRCMDEVLQWVHLQADAPPCALRCKDASDQCFIDLAVQHRAFLISKDKAVLQLAKRLARVGVAIGPTWSTALTRGTSAAVTPSNAPQPGFLG
jgi:predicted nucleic acid-binding protein